MEIKNKSFYWQILTIALPITIQQVIISSGSIIDNLMVSGLGTEAIGSVGAINKFLGMFSFGIYGLTSAGGSFISQFMSRKDSKGIQRIVGISLICNLIFAFIFTFIAMEYPVQIASIFTDDMKTLAMASQYLKVMSLYFLPYAISYAFAYPMRIVGKAKVAMYIISFSQCINIVLNNLLIYGQFGFPALGVKGAALATVIAKIFEMLAIISVIYYNKYIIAGSLKNMISFSASFLVRVLSISMPLTLNELLWSGGLLIYQIAISNMGIDAMAAYGMVAPFEQLLITAFIGLSSAALILVGGELGNNNYEKAYSTGNTFSKIVPVLAILIGIPIAIFSKQIISIYSFMGADMNSISPVAFDQAQKFLKVLGVLLFIRVFNLTFLAGVFKSGGDTMFLFIAETGSLWLVGIPLVFLASQMNIEPYLVYLVAYFEEIVKARIIYSRFKSKKWMKTLIDL